LNIETFRHHCLALKGTTEEFPFGEETLVFKVIGKMFALTDLENFSSINLKVDPETGVELREKYDAVKPGYHMNKKHWITVEMDGSVADRLILQWITDSYELVAGSLTKSQKLTLSKL
jgi:predicted DNA-binding protein (MmcQ/YjbR family)